MRGKGRVKDIKPHKRCMYENFVDMYDGVYKAMVLAKVAVELEEERMYDINGEEVNLHEQCFGRPTRYKVTRQEQIVFVDETGCNTSQKDDGNVGGQRFILPKECTGKTGLTGSVTDIHFTLLCFTSGKGEPIMCAVILKSEKQVNEIPCSWRFRIDITKNIHTTGSSADVLYNNTGNGSAMSGGPTCHFNGKEIPCFVCTSPKASITSQLLADMLQFMDSFNIFDRSNNNRPFLLLGGHHSRLDLPIIDYIHGTGHEWITCIGVPYGTHLWQVADSPQLNGAFKSELIKAKRIFFKAK
jgi:hypothetical protein